MKIKIYKRPKDKCIIGSMAMFHHFTTFSREVKDTDIIMAKENYKKYFEDVTKDFNVDEAPGKHDNMLLKYTNPAGQLIFIEEIIFSDNRQALQEVLLNYTSEDGYITPEALYSLKKGHIHFPVKFQKHIGDLMFLRDQICAKYGTSLVTLLNAETDIIDMHPELTALQYKDTEQRFGKLKTPKMDQTADKFFGKSRKFVKSYYVHDDMHLAVAHTEGKPTYWKILKEGSEVETDINLWNKLSLREKINCVLEEAYVIALERKILPQMFENIPVTYNVKAAFDWALMRICTTLCNGFFREFAVRAYREIQSLYNPDYTQIFFHRIKKFDNK